MTFDRWRFLFTVGSLALASGCSDPVSNNPLPDAGNDDVNTTDTATDAPADTGSDAARDVPRDTATDTATDNGKPPTDVPDDTADAAADSTVTTPDAAADVTEDVAPDAAPDVTADASMDAAMDAADAATDSAADAAVDAPADVAVDAGPAACTAPAGMITLPSATPISIMGTTMGGTNTFTSTRCQANTGGNDRVYTLVVTSRTGVIVSTDNDGTGFDTVLSLRRACGDATSELTCDDDSGIGTSRTTSSVMRAVLDPGTYYIIVDGYSSASGAFTLSASTFTPAENATCATARPVTIGMTLTGQTLDNAGAPTVCSPGGSPGGQVFYSVTIPAMTVATATLSRTSGSWTYSVRSYADCAATTCGATASTSTSPLSVPLINGSAAPRTVIFSVASSSAEATVTPFDLGVTTAALRAGQACENAVAITPGMTLSSQDTTGAPVPGALCQTSSTGGQLFYTLSIPAGQRARVTATPTGTTLRQPVLRVLETCGATTCADSIVGGTSTTPAAASLDIPNTGSTTRTVVVTLGTTSTTTAGTFDVAATLATIEPGQYCAAPATLTPGTTITGVSNATALVTSSVCQTGSTGPQLFYSLTIPANQRARIVATPTGSTLRQPVLRVLDTCTATSCVDSILGGTSTTPAAAVLDVPNNTAMPRTVLVSLGSTSATTAGTWDLAATTSAILPGQFCAAPITVTPGMTLMGQDATRGLRNTTACQTAASGGQTFYSLSVPAGQRVTVTAAATAPTATWRPALRSFSTCTSTSCLDSNLAATDGGSATLTFSNTGTTPSTVLFSVSGSTAAQGTYNLEVGPAMTPPGYTSSTITAACDDMTSGTAIEPVDGWSDDEATDAAALPFGVGFFGTAATHYTVSSNGFMQFWTSSSGVGSTSATNYAIPTSGTPSNFAAPFWDDLITSAVSGATPGVRVATLGTAPNRRFVVQWTDWGIYLVSGVRMTFQAKVFETTNVIEYHYCSMTPATEVRTTGTSATIGVEDATSALGTQISYNAAAMTATGNGYRLTPR